MAKEKNKIEPKQEKAETKKLEEFKETPENKKVIAEAEGKVVEKKEEKIKKDSKKDNPRKVDLEREYVVPLRKNSLTVPKYKRAKRAIKVLRKFIARHMRIEERDLSKVKVDINLNNEVWFRGIKKPLHKVKVKAIKYSDGIVEVKLAEVPEIVQFKIAKQLKKNQKVSTKKVSKLEKKDEKTTEEKKDESEKEKSSVEAGLEKQKVEAKTKKHTTKGAHAKKTMPVRKTLK
jgi:large subunit ribosomal protein L31e